MVVKPKLMRNICMSAHPVGCEKQVEEQINYVKSRGPGKGPRNVLIIGSSNGYGLACAIVSTFVYGARTLGISFEKEGNPKRTGTAGWYNEKAFLKLAEKESYQAWRINGDAFSDEVKGQTIEMIKENMGKVDLVIYSIAAPRREDPDTGELHTSVLKPVGESYTSRLYDFKSGGISTVTLDPATPQEVEETVKVMGGADWLRWIGHLKAANCLAEGVRTLAFSYIGPELTGPVYRRGSIGKAKEDLEKTVPRINELLKDLGGEGIISVNKALVTRASAVIPGVSLYIPLLYKVMKKYGTHENCIQQMDRLYRDFLYVKGTPLRDEKGMIRLDDLEMREEIQAEVAELWEKVTEENFPDMGDVEGFGEEFLKHHGFGIPGVDYEADVEV